MREKNQQAETVLWDKMHFMLRRFNDRMIRVSLKYKGYINEKILADTIHFMVDSTPVLHSSFCCGFFRPKWCLREYDVSDIFTCSESNDPEEAAKAFMLSEIPTGSNVQLKISMFRKREDIVLGIVINHQCMDGGDLISFLQHIFYNYNILITGGAEPLIVKNGSRSHKEIYRELSFFEKIAAKLLWAYRGKIRGGAVIPFDAGSDDDRKRIISHIIPSDTMQLIKSKSKLHSVTLNDIFTAALLSSLYPICDRPATEQMKVSCAVNLRKRRAGQCADTGYTNHTAWMVCGSENNLMSPWELIESVSSQTRALKSDRFLGLYSLPLLNTVFSILPFGIAERLVSLCYGNPPVAMSNLGYAGSESFSVNGAEMLGGFLAGSMKDKPYFMFTVSSFGSETTLSTAINGSDRDAALVEELMSSVSDFLESL